MSITNTSNLIPSNLYGKSVNDEVSIEITPNGIVLGGDLTTTPITATISQSGIITNNPTGFNILSSLNLNSNDITNVDTISGATGFDLNLSSSSQIVLTSTDNTNINTSAGINLNASDYIQLIATNDFINITADDDITLTSNSLNVHLQAYDHILMNAPYSLFSNIAGSSTTIYPTSIVIDDTNSSPPTQTTIASNVCLIDNYHRDYQVKSTYASLSGSTSCYIQNGVCARDKGIGYTITGPPANFNVYYEIKPFFLPYDNCKYRMNISIQLNQFGGGNQDKENQFYFELYDPTAGSVIEGFVFNNAFPYSTFIGMPQSGDSVMNFSYVDYYDLTPFPPLVNGEVWVRFYGAGNGTSGQLRYFVSFDRIEL